MACASKPSQFAARKTYAFFEPQVVVTPMVLVFPGVDVTELDDVPDKKEEEMNCARGFHPAGGWPDSFAWVCQ